MLQRFKRKGPGKPYRLKHVVNGAGWHVFYQTTKGENQTRPVLLFGMATSKDSSYESIVVPYVNMGGGTIARFDPEQVIEYMYHPEPIPAGSKITITRK